MSDARRILAFNKRAWIEGDPSPIVTPDFSAIFGTDLLQWTHASDVPGNDGDLIDTWTGRVAGKNFSPTGNVLDKPKLVLSAIDGKKALWFNHLNNDRGGMVGSVSILAAPFSAIVIAAPTAHLGTPGGRWIQGDSSVHNWLMGPYNQRYTAYNGAFIQAAVGSATPFDWCVHRTEYEIIAGTPHFRYYKNEVLVGQNSNTNVPGLVSIGYGGNYGETPNSYIADIVLASRVPTVDDIAAMTMFVNSEYPSIAL